MVGREGEKEMTKETVVSYDLEVDRVGVPHLMETVTEPVFNLFHSNPHFIVGEVTTKNKVVDPIDKSFMFPFLFHTTEQKILDEMNRDYIVEALSHNDKIRVRIQKKK
jgi:hypothetical protein